MMLLCRIYYFMFTLIFLVLHFCFYIHICIYVNILEYYVIYHYVTTQ